MNCFPCFSSQKSKKESASKKDHESPLEDPVQSRMPEKMEAQNQGDNGNIAAQAFNFRELASATKNFRQECLLGEGGFGRVYKGTLQATGQVVAVKQLDRNAMQENKDFLVEVSQLSNLRHENLVNLIGYCADGDQRLLVYEYMPAGSIEDHLFDIKAGKKPFDWITRMKIAYGAAQGLEYLHDKANSPVIYRDLKSSNVLLDEEFNPKLSDIGLAKLGPSVDKMPMQSRAMGTYGYSAPEYSRSGKLTTVADVYSFGVVLLELITGRRAIDTTKPVDEQNLVAWAQPLFKDPKHFPDMADPILKKKFPERGLNQAVAIAAMCLQDEAAARPLMSDVVTALSFLSMATEENKIPPTLPASISTKLHCISNKLQFLDHNHSKLTQQESSSVREADDSGSESDDQEGGSSNDGSATSRENEGSGSSEEESNRHLSHKYSKQSKVESFTSCHQDSRKSVDQNDDANSSSDDEESDQKSSRKSHHDEDEASSGHKNKKKGDANNKNRSKSEDNEGLNRNSSKKVSDESSNAAAKTKKNGKGKKSQEGRPKKSSKAREESNSSDSGKNNRRRAKKAKDSPSPSSSGVSQEEIMEGSSRQSPGATFTKAKTNNF